MSTTPTSTPISGISDNSMLDSPYTLHMSDNMGALITSVLLCGDNYSKWAIELWNPLQAKQKIGFIDGTITKPTSNADFMIVGQIRTSIDPKVRSMVTHVFDACKIWESLKRRFSVKNGVRKHLIEDKITNCKQNEQRVLEYYSRLSNLCEEFKIKRFFGLVRVKLHQILKKNVRMRRFISSCSVSTRLDSAPYNLKSLMKSLFLARTFFIRMTSLKNIFLPCGRRK